MSFFVVWCPDRGGSYEEGRTLNACTPADAAQQWALCEDYESASYGIAGGHDVTVTVSDGDRELTYIVSGESVPSYRARLVVENTAKTWWNAEMEAIGKKP